MSGVQRRGGVHHLMEMPWLICCPSLSFVMNAQDCEEGRVLYQVQPDGAPQDVWWETRGEPALLGTRSRCEVGIISMPSRAPSLMLHPHTVAAESVPDPLSEMASYGLVYASIHLRFLSAMQRAEVQGNLSILLASSAKITWRTGCERHELIRTYAQASEITATQAFTVQDYIEHRKQSKWAVLGRYANTHAQVVQDTSASYSIQVHIRKHLLFGGFLD